MYCIVFAKHKNNPVFDLNQLLMLQVFCLIQKHFPEFDSVTFVEEKKNELGC